MPAAALGIDACRLVQNSTVSSPGIGGMAAVLPLAITTETDHVTRLRQVLPLDRRQMRRR
jgi:hypothetical protein